MITFWGKNKVVDLGNDLDILKSQGKLEECVYQAMQEDLVRIAKTFKFYYEQSEH